MIWDTFKGLFVEDLLGSYALVGLFFLLAVWGVLLLVGARKEVFVGFSGFYLYYLTISNILPSWLFFIIIIISGVYIAQYLIKAIFGGG